MSSAAVPVDRLRASRDISEVFAERRQRAGRFVVVHARARGDEAATRVAVVASRRVGDAVRRNRAKRLLREAARHVAWQNGLDLVLVARASCAAAQFDDVVADLDEAASSLALNGAGEL
jgi:ribonuclease P protein component